MVLNLLFLVEKRANIEQEMNACLATQQTGFESVESEEYCSSALLKTSIHVTALHSLSAGIELSALPSREGRFSSCEGESFLQVWHTESAG